MRLAVLKTIEYLLDILGCSMDKSLVHILVALIQTYPVNNISADKDDASAHKRVNSFFKSEHLEAKGEGENRFKPSFFSFADLNRAEDCQVKEVAVLHQSYVQSSKNYYNHIFESLLLLLHSMSPDLLLIIYYEVASKYMFHDLVANELKVYLMKFTDKIIHICKGSILLNQELLTNVVRLMLITPAGQSAVNSKQKSKSPDLSSRQDEMLTKMCQALWQTFKTELFVNNSLKGNRILIQWISHQLSQLAEGTGQ